MEDTKIGPAKTLLIENSGFDQVVIAAGESAEDITVRDSTLVLRDILSAGESTLLDIERSAVNAYGQSDGVTNIPVTNITLTGCRVTNGAWEQSGPFKSIQDIKNVSGIGESTFNKLSPYITVD